MYHKRGAKKCLRTAVYICNQHPSPIVSAVDCFEDGSMHRPKTTEAEPPPKNKQTTASDRWAMKHMTNTRRSGVVKQGDGGE